MADEEKVDEKRSFTKAEVSRRDKAKKALEKGNARVVAQGEGFSVEYPNESIPGTTNLLLLDATDEIEAYEEAVAYLGL